MKTPFDTGIDNIDNNKLYYLIRYVTEHFRATMIDTQVILQILIKKNICTIDEVEQMRKIVKNNSKMYKDFIKVINDVEAEFESNKQQSELIAKSISDPSSLTPEEKEKILNMLDSKNFE